MANRIRAKMKVDEVVKRPVSETIKLGAVTSDSEENKSFSKYTPSASLEINITNEAAFGFFEAGKEYYLDFTSAELPAQA